MLHFSPETGEAPLRIPFLPPGQVQKVSLVSILPFLSIVFLVPRSLFSGCLSFLLGQGTKNNDHMAEYEIVSALNINTEFKSFNTNSRVWLLYLW